MSIRLALEALQELPGLQDALVFTQDGLTVERLGSNDMADLLAAELATIGEKVRQGLHNVALGELQRLWLTLEDSEVALIRLPGYWLALVFDGSSVFTSVPSLERAVQPLRLALGGRR